MDPDGIAWLACFEDLVPKCFVDFHVLSPVFFLELGVRRKIVEEWPECAVTKSLIESIHGLPIEEYRPGVLFRSLCPDLFSETFFDLDPGPSDPQVVGSSRVLFRPLQIRGESRDQSAGTGMEDQMFVAIADGEREPIGNY